MGDGIELDVTLHTYPKVGHWFMEEDRPEYDPGSAQLAWPRTYEFLQKNMIYHSLSADLEVRLPVVQ